MFRKKVSSLLQQSCDASNDVGNAMLKRIGLLVFALTGTLISNANADPTYTWNNTGTNWNSASSWSPGGIPDEPDIALFNQNGSAFGSSTTNPSIMGGMASRSLTIAPNQNLGGWTFTGSGNLTLGSSVSTSTGLTTYGPQTTTFNGPTIQGVDSSHQLILNVNYGSTMVLSGTSAITFHQAGWNINGGTLKLDNSVTNIGDRLQVFNDLGIPLKMNGGTIHLIGQAGQTTLTKMGAFQGASSGGMNTIRVDNNGGLATLEFSNGDLNTSKPGTRAVIRYEAVSGRLGAHTGATSPDPTGSRIVLKATPTLGTNGLLGSSSSVGFATVKDSDGINFATYKFLGPTDRRGVISVVNPNSGQTVTSVSTASGLQGFTTGSIGQFDAAAGVTSVTGIVTTGSLRITPTGSGSSLDMGAFNLVTNALMLDGSNDFTISGTGSFGTSAGSKYIYVNDANATLSTSLKFGTSTTNSTVFAGPGFVDLTGTAQNTSGIDNRFVIAGGVVRGNESQIGFTSTGLGVLSLTGGILEIKGGSNGAGATADFTRSLGGTGPGKVSWGGGAVITEKGSGGFSAFGSAASVNIGGSAIPTTLIWNSNDFVADGYALKFGSTKSNNTVNFLNGINLENGADYQLREISVTKGSGTIADRTTISGVISGSAIADFVKTGNGVLEFKAVNTYSGNTLVQGGTLLANGIGATGTGNTSVFTGATLGGTGTVLGNTNVAGGGTIQGGEGFTVNQTLTTTNVTLSHNANLQAVLGNGATANDLNATGASRLVTTGALGRDSTSSIINIQLTNAATDGLNLDGAHTYTRRLATYTSLTNLTTGTYNAGDAGNPFSVSGTNFAVNNNWIVTVNATSFDVTFSPMSPVPEPGTVLAIGAAGLGLFGAFRRYRNRV